MIFGKSQNITWLVVFLGNPGPKYEMTRHNAGFLTADAFVKKTGATIKKLRFHALTGDCTIGDERVLLMKPQTFMNLSGDSVSEAMKFYKIPREHILVVSDDISLPVGKIRVRRSGSAGGHNGLKDIIAKCGGDDFPRIKLGVGIPQYDTIDWVLSVFRNEDAETILETAKRAADAIESVITRGVDASMNDYN